MGAGGRGSWSCCLPWQPAFYAIVAVLLPTIALPVWVSPKLPYALRRRQLPGHLCGRNPRLLVGMLAVQESNAAR